MKEYSETIQQSPLKIIYKNTVKPLYFLLHSPLKKSQIIAKCSKVMIYKIII